MLQPTEKSVIITPDTEGALRERANALMGLRLGEVAAACGVTVPRNLLGHKGWVGGVIETFLGATAGSQALPDFPALGIEVKTLPVNAKGHPTESTFVTVVPLLTIGQESWETSTVRKKLHHVLWVPIETDRMRPLAERRIGQAKLWRMPSDVEAILRDDWEELTEMVCLGQLEYITARLGTYLQIRPKGANAKALCWGISESGEKIQTLPRGFYLRASFTKTVVCCQSFSS